LSEVKAKYRMLSGDELKTLESEFIHFLVVNGITADDWQKLKVDDPSSANKMLVLFSDVIFEGSMRKINFLELRLKNKLHLIQCLDNQMVLVGISGESEETDFRNSTYISESLNNPPDGLSIYTSSKKYEESREQDLFKMIQTGYLISDGDLFKKLSLYL